MGFLGHGINAERDKTRLGPSRISKLASEFPVLEFGRQFAYTAGA